MKNKAPTNRSPHGTRALAAVLTLAALASHPTALSAQEQKPWGGAAKWPPYPAASFWNTAIPPGGAVRPDNAALLAILNADGPLTSDVTQNSYPIYLVDASTPLVSVSVENYFSSFTDFSSANPDGIREGRGFQPTVKAPVPTGAAAGGGDDDQVLFWNPATGDEWTFWKFTVAGDTRRAINGYRYDALLGSGRMPGSGRGAGVSKMGGLVAAHEVEVTGEVRHAVAFAIPSTGRQFVWPASKSDGRKDAATGIPEGARIQLDPALNDADFKAMGLSPQAIVIARALQKYGLILVDGGGRPKAFLESEKTGAWASPAAWQYALRPLTRNASGQTDWSRFRVIDWDRWTGGPTGIAGS